MKCRHCGSTCSQGLVCVRWQVAGLLFVVGIALAYGLGGSLLRDVVEGLRRSTLPLWKLWLTLAVLVLAVVVGFVRLRRPVCSGCGRTSPAWLFAAVARKQAEAVARRGPTRRVFLRALGAGAATVAAAAAGLAAAVGRNWRWLPVVHDFFFTAVQKTAPRALPEWRGARIRDYRRLGRTNVMVSDISLGSSRIKDERIAQQCLDRGVNYFDTAPDYADTGSEQVLGRALKGRRDKVFVATKFCVADGHLPNDTPVPEIMAAVEGSLRRLQTDYVDLIHIHSCDRLDRLMAPNIHEAFDRLRDQGKARFLGFSCHSPNLETVVNAAVDSGRFDVMMLAYHFGMWPRFAHVVERARQNDVGVVAMKTLKGAKHTNLAKFSVPSGAYSQAAFRWVLSNPNLSCLVVSFFRLQHVEEYLYASGAGPAPNDLALLREYDELIAGDYCQPHCGTCLEACAYGVRIDDVLRQRMYFRDYGWQEEAVRRYAELERNAAGCAACAAPCANACPFGVPIQERMVETHGLLSRRT